MPHIPKAVCANCLTELTCVKNGNTIEMMTKFGDGEPSPYYKVDADLWGCKCGTLVFIGFASQPLTEHFQDDYDEVQADTRAEFAN